MGFYTPGYPSTPPSPAPTKKPGMMIEQRDYVTVNYSVTSKLRVRDVKKPKKAVCFTVLQRQHRQKNLPSKNNECIIKAKVSEKLRILLQK